MALLDTCCDYASLKDDVTLVFDGTGPAKTARFMDLSEVLQESPLLEHTSKLE
jgi:hypothetical protein